MNHPRIFEAEYYRHLAEVEGRHWWSRGMQVLGRDILAGLPVEGPLLDAGCGTGGQLRQLPQKWVPHSFGIDVSLHALKLCQERAPRRPLTQATVTDLPFRDRAFSCVVCNDVLQHLSPDHLDQALREFFRITRKGGFLIVRSNSRLGFGTHRSPAPDFRRFLLNELTTLLDNHGFQCLRASYANFLPSLGSVLKRRHSHGDAGLQIRCLPSALGWLNRLLYAYMRLEAILIAKGLRLPYGQSTFVVARRKS